MYRRGKKLRKPKTQNKSNRLIKMKQLQILGNFLNKKMMITKKQKE